MSESETRIRCVEELGSALRIAAELEHNLCCQYLFAEFSVRRSLDDFDDIPLSEADKLEIMAQTRAWATQILIVSRQEMEHLGIVLNLQAALGVAPHFDRPSFPVPKGTYPIHAHFCLERLETVTLDRFLFYERPDYLREDYVFEDPGCCGCGELGNAAPQRLSSHGGLQFNSVQDLYEQIAGAYSGSAALSPTELFAGNPDRQVQSTAVQWSSNVRVPPITNRTQASAAIEQILKEGEGIRVVPTASVSHFSRFTQVAEDFRKICGRYGLEADVAVLPVLCNPTVADAPPQGSRTVTDPVAAAGMRLFDDGYSLMLAMLRGFFETYRGNFGTYPTFPGSRPNTALFLESFYPFMTMFIRPLGEILCRLPAGDEYPGRTAGPAFGLTERVPPPQGLDWYADKLNRLYSDAASWHLLLREREPECRGGIVNAALALSHSVQRMALNLPRLWNEGTLNP